jgi:hypothetical protein
MPDEGSRRFQAAKAKVDDFKRGRPDMAAATLSRVTCSNELVLSYVRAAGSPLERRGAAQEFAKRLTRMPEVAYAGPDLTLQTQH